MTFSKPSAQHEVPKPGAHNQTAASKEVAKLKLLTFTRLSPQRVPDRADLSPDSGPGLVLGWSYRRGPWPSDAIDPYAAEPQRRLRKMYCDI